MPYWIQTNAFGGKTFREGGTPPEGAVLLSEAEYRGQLAAHVPAAPGDLAAFAAETHARVLGQGVRIDVAPADGPEKRVLCDGTSATRASLALLVLAAQADAEFVSPWLANDGVVTSLSAPEILALATAVGGWIARTYGVLGGLQTDIAAGRVTTRAAIVAAYAAL